MKKPQPAPAKTFSELRAKPSRASLLPRRLLLRPHWRFEVFVGLLLPTLGMGALFLMLQVGDEVPAIVRAVLGGLVGLVGAMCAGIGGELVGRAIRSSRGQ